MDLLEALAAFALAMLLFSTIVSAIIEVVLNRILKLRQQGFRRLLERVYDDVLAPKFQASIQNLNEAGRDPRRDFIVAISSNPGVTPNDDRPPAEEAGKLAKAGHLGKQAAGRFGSLFASGRVAALDAVQFAERLADTEIGRVVAREARDRRDVLIDDLALKFERFGEGTREYFTQRSRTISIFVAIGLALVANIDAAALFDGFLKDPMARSTFLARAETISEAYLQSAGGPTPAAAAPTPADGTPPAGGASDADKSVDELRELAKSVNTQIAVLESMSLRVGWGYFPWCDAEKMTKPQADAIQRLGGIVQKYETKTIPVWVGPRAADSRCNVRFRTLGQRMDDCVNSKDASKRDETMVAECLEKEIGVGATYETLKAAPLEVSAAWVFFCVLAGFLIGLGGPFWFNVYANLSRVLQVARQVRGVFGARKARDDKEAKSEEGGARKPADPVEAFERAATANDSIPRDSAASDWEEWRARMRGRVAWTPR